MTLLQRLGYYLGGFSIGLIFLAFFLSGKRTSCSYGPNSRVLKNIRTKPMVYSDEVTQLIAKKTLDTAAISYLLNRGDVNFSESNTDLDSCKIYVIEDRVNEKDIKLTIRNCDSLATLMKAHITK